MVTKNTRGCETTATEEHRCVVNILTLKA